ncbi:hypothetical protein [Serratia silvae]|uniref:Uncharacterized protein n=1 Tax=Serratia silvae TaxID=2824122 RepID=A0ABT0K651_9GAMM|nr:hypothetical protein [Serratia silvae]MCL1027495.1 hypothetical protein [Serratia silvae]
MAKIVELWNKEELPIKDGVYFSSGKSIAISISTYPDLVIEKGSEFDLEGFLNEGPEEITNIDIMQKVTVNDKFQCFLGEGSHGSEGFIAYLTIGGELEWVMYFEQSNPFVKVVKLSNETIEVESSANYKLIINVDEPENFIASSKIQ